MEYVKLGRTGLDVSRICLGCMSYGAADSGNHAGSGIVTETEFEGGHPVVLSN